MQIKPPFNLSGPSLKAALVLCFLLLGQILVSAQNGKDPLEQAKLDIWTETAAFVYTDANMPEPQTIAMANSMNAFVVAIRAEDAKSHIYSKVYQPIEQTGTYKRGSTAQVKLDILIKSINSKLRENTQRMQDINRRQRLGDLYKQLQQIASDYTNPAAAGNGLTEAVDSLNADAESFTTPVSTRTEAETAGENEYAENQLSSLSKKETSSGGMDWLPVAALVLGLINLGLFYFLYKGIDKLNQRMDQRKKEIDNLTQQVNTGGSRISGNNGKPNMAEIESMVQKAIARETAKFRTSPDSSAASPQERPIKAANPKATPLTVESQPEAVSEPVSAPASAPAPEKPLSKFARVPVNGGFHEQDLHNTQQHDSIYEIRVSKKDPHKAAFRIVPNSSVHRTAIESAYLSLKDACNYQLDNQHANRIVTDEPGMLTYQDGFWKIDKKAQIHFE